MTFFGEARWDEGHEGHAVHPHESPAIMTVPLVVLAVFSTVIGVIDLPFGGLDFLEQLHEPLFGDIVREVSLSGAAEVGLIIIATVLAFLGIFAAYQAWVLRKVEADRLEPEVLQRGWYLNDAYAAFFGGPATVGAEFTSDVVDHEVIDGAVNGVGVLVRSGAGQLRKLQSGYVRSYALGIAAGAVLLLAWFFSRVSV
jgi:NADH-quinone oxidoreductase subunit L